jgi:hypothetical protein
MSSEAGGVERPGAAADAAAGGDEATARQAPTEQQKTEAGTPKRFAPGQTVCNERNEKGKLCNGHLKQLNTQHPAEVFLRGDDALHRCQTCGALYLGPPLGHVRDPRKQRRYVERDLAVILRAAGGTLPAYDYPAPEWRDQSQSDALSLANANYETTAASPDRKRGKRPVTDSSPAADRHRPAAEA